MTKEEYKKIIYSTSEKIAALSCEIYSLRSIQNEAFKKYAEECALPVGAKVLIRNPNNEKTRAAFISDIKRSPGEPGFRYEIKKIKKDGAVSKQSDYLWWNETVEMFVE
ncbi:MAG: hypothetical protein KDC70_00130 [Saprospiraceae bacterium]|nr:hypothetical protein [Saprospiraceae bacterium]